METELTLSIGGFPPFSARNCTQELFPVGSGQFKRTLNGELIFVVPASTHQKYASSIKGKDKTVLALEGVWRGTLLKVGCLQYIWQKVRPEQAIVGSVISLERMPVEQSVGILCPVSLGLKVGEVCGKDVHLGRGEASDDVGPESFPSQDVFLSYRPWLDMRVMHFSLFTDEWGLKSGWRLDLEEV